MAAAIALVLALSAPLASAARDPDAPMLRRGLKFGYSVDSGDEATTEATAQPTGAPVAAATDDTASTDDAAWDSLVWGAAGGSCSDACTAAGAACDDTVYWNVEDECEDVSACKTWIEETYGNPTSVSLPDHADYSITQFSGMDGVIIAVGEYNGAGEFMYAASDADGVTFSCDGVPYDGYYQFCACVDA